MHPKPINLVVYNIYQALKPLGYTYGDVQRALDQDEHEYLYQELMRVLPGRDRTFNDTKQENIQSGT